MHLVVCTDGVLTAASARDESYGYDRVEDVLRNYAQASASGCARALFDAVDRFRRGTPQRDDETVLIVDRQDLPPGGEYQI